MPGFPIWYIVIRGQTFSVGIQVYLNMHHLFVDKMITTVIVCVNIKYVNGFKMVWKYMVLKKLVFHCWSLKEICHLIFWCYRGTDDEWWWDSINSGKRQSGNGQASIEGKMLNFLSTNVVPQVTSFPLEEPLWVAFLGLLIEELSSSSGM